MLQSKKPKILVVIDSLMLGGAQVVSLRLFESLISNGYDCDLVTFFETDGKDAFSIPGRSQKSLGGAINNFAGIIGKLRLTLRLREYLKKNNVDLIISCLPSTNCLSIIASTGLPLKVIVTEHMDPYQDEDTDIKWRFLRRLLYHRANSLVGVSRGVTNSFSWLPNTKRKTIYNFISLDQLSIVEPPRRGKFLCLGRFIGRKGFGDAIKAFSIVHKHFRETTLSIYGYGPEKENLEKLIKSLGLEDAVKIFPSDKNIESLYKNHDVILFPSYAEGLGNIILEAMACARPVIAYDCNYGPRELIVHNQSGYLVPLKDYKTFANCMLYLMNNPDKSRNMGLKAVTLFNELHNSNCILKEWENLIFEVTND